MDQKVSPSLASFCIAIGTIAIGGVPIVNRGIESIPGIYSYKSYRDVPVGISILLLYLYLTLTCHVYLARRPYPFSTVLFFFVLASKTVLTLKG